MYRLIFLPNSRTGSPRCIFAPVKGSKCLNGSRIWHCRTRDERQFLSVIDARSTEKILQCDLALDDVAVEVVLETVGGDEGKKNRLAGIGLGFATLAQIIDGFSAELLNFINTSADYIDMISGSDIFAAFGPIQQYPFLSICSELNHGKELCILWRWCNCICTNRIHSLMDCRPAACLPQIGS